MINFPATELNYNFSFIIIYLAIIILFAEILNRFTHLTAEQTRKIVHIGTGNVILFAWWFNIPAWAAISASFVAGFLALFSYFLPILPSISSVGRQSLGTFFYAVSIGVLVDWFWPIGEPQYAAIGILVMAWGDGMAAIIGQKFGKHSYQAWGNDKSWEGSFGMLIFSFLATLGVLGFLQGITLTGLIIAVSVAIFATSLESFSKLGIDNLTVPIGSASLAFFLSNILG
jgi:phytol kinase